MIITLLYMLWIHVRVQKCFTKLERYFKVTVDVHLSFVFRLYEVMFTKVRLQFDAMLGV